MKMKLSIEFLFIYLIIIFAPLSGLKYVILLKRHIKRFPAVFESFENLAKSFLWEEVSILDGKWYIFRT